MLFHPNKWATEIDPISEVDHSTLLSSFYAKINLNVQVMKYSPIKANVKFAQVLND